MYWVLHVDLDQFIAAVEVLRRPELAGQPVVVGGHGDPTRRGVVATASYAAREYGVRSGMPLRTAARRCPDAVFLPADNPAYEAASEEVMAVLRSFGPSAGAVVEVHGLGRGVRRGHDGRPRGARPADPGGGAHADPADLLRRRRRQPAAGQDRDGVREAARARATAGRCVGTGVFTLTAQNWDAVMGDRSTRALWGIGAKTAAKLADRGLHTVRELAAADPAALAADLGPALGPWYVQLGRGLGRVEVRGEPWLARSRGHEETFAADLTDWADVRAAAAGLARQVAADVRPRAGPRRGWASRCGSRPSPPAAAAPPSPRTWLVPVPSTLTARTGRTLSPADPTGEQHRRDRVPTGHDIGGPPGEHPEIAAPRATARRR